MTAGDGTFDQREATLMAFNVVMRGATAPSAAVDAAREIIEIRDVLLGTAGTAVERASTMEMIRELNARGYDAVARQANPGPEALTRLADTLSDRQVVDDGDNPVDSLPDSPAGDRSRPASTPPEPETATDSEIPVFTREGHAFKGEPVLNAFYSFPDGGVGHWTRVDGVNRLAWFDRHTAQWARDSGVTFPARYVTNGDIGWRRAPFSNVRDPENPRRFLRQDDPKLALIQKRSAAAQERIAARTHQEPEPRWKEPPHFDDLPPEQQI